MDKVNLADKLALFEDHWSPKVVGEWDDQHVNWSSSSANSSGIITNTKMNCSWS
jgi:hypothetical protein